MIVLRTSSRRLICIASVALLPLLSAPPTLGASRRGGGDSGAEIHALVDSGDVTRIRDLLEKNPTLVNASDREGGTVLMHASYSGRDDVVRILLDRGADVHSADRERATALHFAAHGPSTPVIELLLVHGAAINAKTKRGHTPLDWAADVGAAETLALLLERGADPNGGDSKWNPLLWVARHGLREIAEKMISAGARVDARDPNDETALFWVARGGVTTKAETVLYHLEGMKAPTYSNQGDFVGTAELLISRGSDVKALNNGRSTPLHVAAETGRTDVAEVYLRHGASPDARDWRGQTPLMRAAEMGQAVCASLLLDHGAEVDALDDWRWTPLYGAARGGQAEVAAVLIERGADVNWKTPGGGRWFFREDFHTPLEQAAHWGHAEVVELLLRAGADPNVPKEHGDTALQSAVKMGRRAIADTLRAHGALR